MAKLQIPTQVQELLDSINSTKLDLGEIEIDLNTICGQLVNLQTASSEFSSAITQFFNDSTEFNADYIELLLKLIENSAEYISEDIYYKYYNYYCSLQNMTDTFKEFDETMAKAMENKTCQAKY